ncbi:hypothetical protein L6164_031271 [Bauhinia variegata]|uniref:Uncharacterized protein n=1 Tax=Bauhinia variegata TaxID=167791 RepID=A0ACB9LEY8_BAUVA|nr:hypothetical protein L6164_031271 [Bauhinia variegata]
MAKYVTPGRLMIQDENLDLHPKKAVFSGKAKNSKTVGKKDDAGLGGRKALNDITNKKSVQADTSSRKKNLPKEEFNVKEEMFLHDHKKCIESKKAAMRSFNIEMVLPRDGFTSIPELDELHHTKAELDSPRCYPEPEEMPVSLFSDWLNCSMPWRSPPSSPIRWLSPPSPFGRRDEPLEFVLKEEIDASM